MLRGDPYSRAKVERNGQATAIRPPSYNKVYSPTTGALNKSTPVAMGGKICLAKDIARQRRDSRLARQTISLRLKVNDRINNFATASSHLLSYFHSSRVCIFIDRHVLTLEFASCQVPTKNRPLLPFITQTLRPMVLSKGQSCSKSLRASGIYTTNLAISDFLSPLMTYYLFTGTSPHKIWVYGELTCRLYGFTQGFFGLMSIVTLAVISAERCYVIKNPFKARDILPWHRILITVFVWIYCFAVASPPVFGWSRYGPAGFLTSCCFDYLSRTWEALSFVMYLFTLGFIIPVAIIIYSYYHIFMVVHRAETQGNMTKSAGGGTAKKADTSKSELTTTTSATSQLAIKKTTNVPRLKSGKEISSQNSTNQNTDIKTDNTNSNIASVKPPEADNVAPLDTTVSEDNKNTKSAQISKVQGKVDHTGNSNKPMIELQETKVDTNQPIVKDYYQNGVIKCVETQHMSTKCNEGNGMDTDKFCTALRRHSFHYLNSSDDRTETLHKCYSIGQDMNNIVVIMGNRRLEAAKDDAENNNEMNKSTSKAIDNGTTFGETKAEPVLENTANCANGNITTRDMDNNVVSDGMEVCNGAVERKMIVLGKANNDQLVGHDSETNDTSDQRQEFSQVETKIVNKTHDDSGELSNYNVNGNCIETNGDTGLHDKECIDENILKQSTSAIQDLSRKSNPQQKKKASWTKKFSRASIKPKKDKLSKQTRKDVKTARITLIVIFTFVLAWTPYAVVAVLGQFGPLSWFGPSMAMIPAIFAKTSTVYNPLIYAFKDDKFIKALKALCPQIFIKAMTRTATSTRSASMMSNSSVSETTEGTVMRRLPKRSLKFGRKGQTKK